MANFLAAGLGSIIGLLIAQWFHRRDMRRMSRELGLPEEDQ